MVDGNSSWYCFNHSRINNSYSKTIFYIHVKSFWNSNFYYIDCWTLRTILSYIQLNETNLPSYNYPVGIENKLQFARAGQMHNASYIGGIIGIITGMVSIAIFKIIE